MHHSEVSVRLQETRLVVPAVGWGRQASAPAVALYTGIVGRTAAKAQPEAPHQLLTTWLVGFGTLQGQILIVNAQAA